MMDFLLQVCKDNDDMLSCTTDDKNYSFQHEIEIEMRDLEPDSQENGETISDHSNESNKEAYVSYTNYKGEKISIKMTDVINSI